MLKIEFENPNHVLVGKERKSKLIKQDSDLYRELTRKRSILETIFGLALDGKRMDFHIELIKDDPTDDVLICRAQMLEGSVIDSSNYAFTGKSIGLSCPHVDGYGKTHITLGFFPTGLPTCNFVDLLK
jgi:hypothetical protein